MDASTFEEQGKGKHVDQWSLYRAVPPSEPPSQWSFAPAAHGQGPMINVDNAASFGTWASMNWELFNDNIDDSAIFPNDWHHNTVSMREASRSFDMFELPAPSRDE
jgi:hypothetical protein